MKPAVNQVKMYLGNPSPKLVAYYKAEEIYVSGYSPLGSTNSPLKGNETIKGGGLGYRFGLCLPARLPDKLV